MWEGSKSVRHVPEEWKGVYSIYTPGGMQEMQALSEHAREMHEFLEVNWKFADWVQERIRKYGFVDGEDFFRENGKSTGGRPTTEYFFTIDVAKELAMVENNARGRQVRKYFIECEKRLKESSGAISTKDAEKLKLQAKRIEIMDRNARSRQAQLLKSTAEFFKDILSDVAMQAIASEVTMLVAGERLVEVPEIEKLYSAAEIGEICGISANMVGYIANEFGLKTEEYGKFVLEKSPYNTEQITTFRYKGQAVDKIKEFLQIMRKKLVEESKPMEA
jgi:phage anti-repressor protein